MLKIWLSRPSWGRALAAERDPIPELLHAPVEVPGMVILRQGKLVNLEVTVKAGKLPCCPSEHEEGGTMIAVEARK